MQAIAKLSHAQEPNETFFDFTIFIYNRLAGGSAGRIKRKSDTNLHQMYLNIYAHLYNARRRAKSSCDQDLYLFSSYIHI